MKKYNNDIKKYYLEDVHVQFFEKYDNPIFVGNESGKGSQCLEIGNLHYYNYDEMNRVYSVEGICPTLRTMQGGNRQPKILIE